MRANLLKLSKIVAGLVLASTVAAASASAQRDRDDDWQSRRLEGTWIFQISLQDCSSGTPLGAPFQSLLTFARGGTVTETTANAMFFPALRGPGHGVWSHAGNGTYRAATIAFITLNGALTRTQTIAQTIELGRDETLRTTSATVKFFSPAGTLLATGCASATGKRFVLDDPSAPLN